MTKQQIWEDPEVQQIYFVREGLPILRHDLLDGPDALLIELWMSKDSILDDSSPANSFSEACLAGISAIERCSATIADGWRKLILFRVGEVARGLWEFRQDSRAAAYAD